MLETLFLVFGMMGLALVGLSMGVIFSNKELKGSCGGIGNIPGLESNCHCKTPCEKKQQLLRTEEKKIIFRK